MADIVSTLPLSPFYTDGAKIIADMDKTRTMVEQLKLRELLDQGHQIVMLVPAHHHIMPDCVMEMYEPVVDKMGETALDVLIFRREADGITPASTVILCDEAADAVRLLLRHRPA